MALSSAQEVAGLSAVIAVLYPERDAALERVAELEAALEWIDECFPHDGKRVTYGDPDETMDRIREKARAALQSIGQGAGG